jgi:hypothetical protein
VHRHSITHRPRPERSAPRTRSQGVISCCGPSRRCHTTNAMGTAASSGGHQRCKHAPTSHNLCCMAHVCACSAHPQDTPLLTITHMAFCFRFAHAAAHSMPSKRWTKADGTDGGLRAELDRLTRELKVCEPRHGLAVVHSLRAQSPNHECALFVPLHLTACSCAWQRQRPGCPHSPFVPFSVRLSVAPRRAATGALISFQRRVTSSDGAFQRDHAQDGRG